MLSSPVVKKIIILFCGLLFLFMLVFSLWPFLTEDKQKDRMQQLIHWRACQANTVSLHTIRCGLLNRDGYQIPFAILTPAGKTENTSSPTEIPPVPLVYIAGGPGDHSGLDSAGLEEWSYWLDRIKLKSSLVLFDQRGTGEFLATCPGYIESMRSIFRENLTASEEAVHGEKMVNDCLENMQRRGLSSQWFSTRASVSDMMALLDALSFQRVDLYGVSYGTRLAMEFIRQQPERVRAAVLDSVYPPWHGQNTEWVALYQLAIDKLDELCEQERICNKPQSVLSEELLAVLDQLREAPVTLQLTHWLGEPPVTLVVNDSRFLSIIYSAMYETRTAIKIPQAINEIRKKTYRRLQELSEDYVNYALDESFATFVYYAVECNDNPLTSVREYQAALQNYPAISRYFEQGWDTDFCRYWPKDSTAELSKQWQTKVPLLLLSGGIDPVTPAKWAREVAQRSPLSQHIHRPYAGHAIVNSEPCIEASVKQFLVAPTQPVTVNCQD